MTSSPSSSSPPPPLPLPPPQPSSQSHSSSPSLSPKHEPRHPPARESNPRSPPKKSSPVHWTDQETLALIQAYQEKWYSLKKGQLKAFQWEEVAVTVAARCGYDEPSKTSTQCRHKIEKLRKRYRSELQKPYAGSGWQYFEHMDQMERGPMPLNARPIAAVKSFPVNANTNSNNSNDIAHGYGSLYSSSADYYNNSHSYGDGGGSDESDEDWNRAEVATRNKSKSINNLLRADVKKGVRSVRRVAMDRGGVSGGGNRVVGALRELMKENPRDYGIDDDSDDDEDEDEDDVEEEHVQVEEEGGDGGMELASEIRGFAEKFIGMENTKIEMMRETHRYRMEMEKRRMEMILDAEKKTIDTIDRAFGAYKKAKVARET